MSLGGPVGTIVGLLATNRFGRKPVIVASTITASAFGAVYVTLEEIEGGKMAADTIAASLRPIA